MGLQKNAPAKQQCRNNTLVEVQPIKEVVSHGFFFLLFFSLQNAYFKGEGWQEVESLPLGQKARKLL